MGDIGEYLRAYRAFVSANLGWRKALRFVLLWLAGMFVPLIVRACRFRNGSQSHWMIIWASLGYVFAPYGLWKHQRQQANVSRTENSRR
jgi:hypothetical protein